VERLWQLLGGRTVLVSAEEHDRSLALTGHLPRIAAAAVARMAEEVVRPGGAGEHLAGGDLLEVTRLLANPPEGCDQALALNADRVAPHLREMAAELTAVAEKLEAAARAGADHDDDNGLAAWLETASRFRRRLEGE
jgi:prephenate dehydrogenase